MARGVKLFVLACAMRCIIGFFGLTRSLRHTAASIRAMVYAPLERAGMTTLRAGHFNLPERIDNPRSGEHGILPDRHESLLLDLDLCWTERQSESAIAVPLGLARRFPDPFSDRYRSLSNLCHQLRSLNRLWSMMELLGVADDDLVLLLRPDLRYLDALDPLKMLAPLRDGTADLIVPSWQSWGGLNDRFAFGTRRGAGSYATRISHFAEACAALRGMHPESFLQYVARRDTLRVATTDMRGVRVRANGRIPQNDSALLAPAAVA